MSCRLRSGKQSAAQLQFGLADTVGEEAELADAHQSSGQYVQQETAQELDRIERHEFPTGAVSIVFPFKAHPSALERTETVVGDGDAMGIAGQILQHAAGSAE